MPGSGYLSTPVNTVSIPKPGISLKCSYPYSLPIEHACSLKLSFGPSAFSHLNLIALHIQSLATLCAYVH